MPENTTLPTCLLLSYHYCTNQYNLNNVNNTIYYLSVLEVKVLNQGIRKTSLLSAVSGGESAAN
jgi:hypothetical protein